MSPAVPLAVPPPPQRPSYVVALATIGVAVAMAIIALNYLVVSAVPPRPGTVSVVYQIDTAVPWLWPLLHGVGALALLASLHWPRMLPHATTLGTAVLAFFDVELWIGSLTSTPVSSLVAPGAVLGLAIGTAAFALASWRAAR